MNKKPRVERRKSIHVCELLHRRLRIHAALRGVSLGKALDELIEPLLPQVPKSLRVEPERGQSAA